MDNKIKTNAKYLIAQSQTAVFAHRSESMPADQKLINNRYKLDDANGPHANRRAY